MIELKALTNIRNLKEGMKQKILILSRQSGLTEKNGQFYIWVFYPWINVNIDWSELRMDVID